MVEAAIIDNVAEENRFLKPKEQLLKRAANGFSAKMRPSETEDLDFDYGVYISQLIRFARAPSHITDFNNRDKFLNAKLLKQGYRYHKLGKVFSKFYRRYIELIKNIMSV